MLFRSVSGDHLGTQSLTLLTYDSPGAEQQPDGTFAYRSNDGTDFGNFDNQYPYDAMFALGPAAPGYEQNMTLSIYAIDNAATTYNSALFGISQDGSDFYSYNNPAAFNATEVSAAPEPGAWALMMLGVGLIGWAFGYRKRVLVDHKAKLAAIG